MAGICHCPKKEKKMRTLRLTVASTATRAIYHLQGPSWLTHRRSFESQDPTIDALVAGLNSIPWLKLARREHGIKTSGKLLPLMVFTHDAALIEAGAYLRSLECPPKDLPTETQHLWSLLQKYDLLWRKLDTEDVQGLNQWAETVAE